MASQRQLQSSAHADAANGRDDRLGVGLDDANHAAQCRLRRCLGRIEFADVGAARERLAGTDEEDGLDTSIGARPVDALDQAGAQSVIQPVERRIVEGDHRHRVVQLIFSADDSCSFDPCYYVYRAHRIVTKIKKVPSFPRKRESSGFARTTLGPRVAGTTNYIRACNAFE